MVFFLQEFAIYFQSQIGAFPIPMMLSRITTYGSSTV